MTEHDENMEMDNVIVLIDENGEEVEFEIIDMVQIDEEEYAILLPRTEDGVADEYMILKIGIDENGDEILSEIDDDDEWEMVANIYMEALEEGTQN